MSTVVGQANPFSDATDFNAVQFMIAAALAKLQTVSVVEVMAVHGGGVAPTGTVDVKVLVNLMTGNRTAIPHGTIYNVPFVRTQGGTNAVICDPVVGDIGMAAFASRDISAVKASRAAANPGSQRSFDWSDAIYVGGMLNGTPAQYVMFNVSGIEVVSPTALSVTAPVVTINASTSVTVTSPAIALDASTSVTVTSPTIALDGNVTIAGTLNQTGGGASTLSGNLTATGTIYGETEVTAGAGHIPLSVHQHEVKNIQLGSSNIFTEAP
jgi:hypothetical protein